MRGISLFTGLSARLLVLTVLFVMLAEVLIYAPSAGRFRYVYLQDMLSDAHLAGLAVEATPEGTVQPELERLLLAHVGAHKVVLRDDTDELYMLGGPVPDVDAYYDITTMRFFPLILDAFETLFQWENRVLQVTGRSPADPGIEVEVIIDERPMRDDLLGYSHRILQLSLIISAITAALVYLSLQWLIVRPLGRLTEAMVHFREAPEDPTRLVPASRRRDEIGLAQRVFAEMQHGIRSALGQRARLAALGEAVTKINHDLRNILATAQLVSDHVAESADPQVRRVAPTLLSAIDRAIALCRKVLEFAKAGHVHMETRPVRAARLVDEVWAGVVRAGDRRPRFVNRLPDGLEIAADPDQLARVLDNLLRNAVAAEAERVDVAGEAIDGEWVAIRVSDNGPGLPESVRQHLFQPFAGHGHGDGSGLGLAIARELVQAHGGQLALERTGPEGTVFVMTLPRARAPDRSDEGGTRR